MQSDLSVCTADKRWVGAHGDRRLQLDLTATPVRVRLLADGTEDCSEVPRQLRGMNRLQGGAAQVTAKTIRRRSEDEGSEIRRRAPQGTVLAYLFNRRIP
mmetsp:Transcript_40655/g.161226  ORF Transcript_40655/g.161226 Transcript_40655/m.161226 type:complete len:100 (+) Transcript_40655:301-600(+)